MYIYPNTRLLILNNVNLNHDYDHTIYFDGKIAQTEYFLGKKKFELTNQSYQRKERGWIQVELNQNQLWDCTYLMFQNTNYYNPTTDGKGTNYKWFYAFILSVDYVNESVSKINFEIDVMQTWYFDYQLDKCFVEREHALTDVAGDNTIEEDLDLGPDYHVQANARYNLDCTRLMIVESGRWNTTTQEYVPYEPAIHLNYFTGVHFVSFDLKDSTSKQILQAHLEDYIKYGVEDSILEIYQYPRFMGAVPFNLADEANYGYVTTDYAFYPNTVQIDGYIPKNRKLFTYPYNLIEVDNGLGNTCELKLEMWDNEHVGNFRIFGTPHGIPTCMCMPVYYNGETNSYQNGLTVKVDVQSAWSGDAFYVWLARNRKNLNLEYTSRKVMSVVNFAAGAAMEDPKLMLKGIKQMASVAHDQVVDTLKKKNETDATPDPVHGQVENDLFNVQADLNHFAFRQKTIRQEYAKIIDEYFSKFGYACHRVKVPNIKARRNWTYTKTVECELNGNIPSDDITMIKSIYDHGVTFWDIRYANVGEYGDFTNPTLS